MASDLLVRVLGPLRLMRDDQEIDVGGARQREVLARLAVANAKPVSAETLLDDVWGPVAGESATASLHVSISKLRRAIDPDRQARASSPLVSTAGGYALALDTDADQMEQRARRASELLAAGDPELAHERWRRYEIGGGVSPTKGSANTRGWSSSGVAARSCACMSPSCTRRPACGWSVTQPGSSST